MNRLQSSFQSHSYARWRCVMRYPASSAFKSSMCGRVTVNAKVLLLERPLKISF
jgi:hypothetical protein